MPSKHALGLLFLLVLPFLFAGRAGADDFLYPAPGSEVYNRFVISAGGTITVETGSHLSGNLHSNGSIDLKAGSSVSGAVSAVGQILGTGTVSGGKTAGAPAVALPPPFAEAAARGLANRVVEGNATFDTDQVINDILFVDGDVRFRASVNGTGTVIASGSILFDNVTNGHPVALGAATRLSFVASLDISIGKDRPLRGVLVSGRDIVFDKSANVAGVVVAGRNLWIHKDSSFVKLILNAGQSPSVAITSPANGAFVNTPTLRVTGTVGGGTLQGVTVNGVAATVVNGTFAADVPLSEGANVITVRAVGSAGQVGTAAATVTLDTVAPVLAISSPLEGRTIAESAPPISASYTDEGSGIASASLAATLDGTAVTGCSAGPASVTCAASILTGDHQLTVQVRDRAGNLARAARSFSLVLDRMAPSVAIMSPAQSSLLASRTVQVTGTAADDSAVASLTINGQPAAVSGGQFSAYVTLDEGTNVLRVAAVDLAGRQATGSVTVTVDSAAPSLFIESPREGLSTNLGIVRVTGRVEDAGGVARLEVNGQPVTLQGDRFDRETLVQEGANTISVRAVDRAGNTREVSLEVVRFTLPTVEIEFPVDLSYISASTVEVRGSVSDPGAAVIVNGIQAQVAGTSFVAQNVSLIEGGNILTATVTTAAGRVGADSINVVRDLTPPHLAVRDPRDGAELFDDSITVSGLVNDIVAGTVNASEVTVTVNGRPGRVANRSFVAEGVSLAPGENVLAVVATDESGNVGRTEIRVWRIQANLPRITAVSGNRQSGAIGSLLPQPLVVQLTDATGLPVAGKPVLLKVVDSDGSLDGGRRQVAVTTGADGRAQVHFKLGSRSGVDNQGVEATVSRFRGPAVFTATALPGEPALIVVDAGDQQVGIAGRALPRPLVATVTDSGYNRLAGAPVLFRIVRGQGQFQNRQQQISVETDSDGRAIVPFILDPDEGAGNNVAEAVIEGLANSPVASFVGYGWAAGDAAQTAVSGIVVDNSNVPIQGVTLRILDTTITARTNEKGLFRIQPAPVGTVKLVVDGSTAARPGSWPDLEFVMTTVAGRNNDLGMPIYLLPLDLTHGVVVDETRGGKLTLPEVPGFALEIQPGSVTFPNGSRSGVVSVTAVHSDKVPMVPNFGQQPRLIVTIQPAGARFDPPARLTLPNVEGLKPGQVTEFYSFDHDLGHFVSIGPGTVSEDGTVIVSNPGVGILKAGWHCGGTPAGAGTPNDCPQCTKCVNNNCTPDDSQSCDDKNDCTINDRCQGGTCKGDPVEVRAINGSCVAPVSQALSLTADSNAPDKVKWQAPSGNPASGTGGSFSVTYSAEGDFVVTAMCGGSSKTKNVAAGPSCASITHRLNEIEGSQPPDPGAFGQVHRVQHSGKYKDCVDSKWCFRLEEFLEEHNVGVTAAPDGVARTDVTSATSSAVTPGTCVAIIADLTPPGAGAGQGPPRTTYYSSPITLAHERFHVSDYRTRVSNPTMNDLAAFVSQSSHCTDCKSSPPDSTFNTKMEQLWTTNRQSYLSGGGHEVRAHDHSNPMYTALIQQIRQRARNAPASAGWPNACK